MSNYPLGAEHDPSAPYNQSDSDDLCIYCHISDIRHIASEKAEEMAERMNAELGDGRESFDSDDFYDVCLEEELNKRTMCRQCYDDDQEDDWRDEI